MHMHALFLRNDRLHVPARHLRSVSDIPRLLVTSSRKKVGEQACDVVAPSLWNTLPTAIRNARSLHLIARQYGNIFSFTPEIEFSN